MVIKTGHDSPVAFETDLSADLLSKARALHVDVHAVIQRAVAAQANLADIERQIALVCEQQSSLVYHHLIDNYPLKEVGIRDCYRKSK
ncbi:MULTISPECIES: hypothetical protein [Gammaproteobacteria]|uniref:hypothetical protein n=1 Tax=Gammaproteobacteria TaxID=1236 RepID=UPI001ADB2F5A|nr:MULTISPECIES: hypothetical protein [Gammaproteobacteria]MBO9481852.1 hypothetical protein [Salinisphaera sp. G21_0]MBO9492832.1 hypothetical protein [Thalassotalea sp. G20_0]